MKSTISNMDTIAPLRHFVTQMTHLMGQSLEESFVRPKAKALLKELISSDDWLLSFAPCHTRSSTNNISCILIP